jgi:hypothetical protein
MPKVGYRQNPEHIVKRMKNHYGMKHSETAKKKMSIARTKNPVRYWLEKKRPEETKRKISLSKKGVKRAKEWGRGQHNSPLTEFKKGEKNINWNNGSSSLPYSIDWTKTLRKSVKERDHYICKICLGEGEIVHHIDYDKNNCELDNLITLCRKCHTKTNYNRAYWTNRLYNL